MTVIISPLLVHEGWWKELDCIYRKSMVDVL